MGQGVHSTLAALVAEELEVAWAQVAVEARSVEQVLFARNAYFQSEESFARYLAAARIDGLIVPHDKAKLPPHQHLVVAE